MGWFNSQNDNEFKDLLITTYDTQMSNQINRLYQMNSNGQFDSTRVIIDGQMVSGRDSLVGFVLFAKDVERKTGKRFTLNI